MGTKEGKPIKKPCGCWCSCLHWNPPRNPCVVHYEVEKAWGLLCAAKSRAHTAPPEICHECMCALRPELARILKRVFVMLEAVP